MNRIFAWLFILTGIFAIAGGLYTWGDGSIFDQNELVRVLIPWADIILTGPISLVCGMAILKKKHWGHLLGLVTSGIYLFGSILVFVRLFWNAEDSLLLLLPSVSGLLIAVGYIIWFFSNRRDLLLR